MTTTNIVLYLAPWVALVLVAFFLLRKDSPIGGFMRLIALSVTAHSSRNAVAYLIGTCLVLGATLTGFYDNFNGLTVDDWGRLGWWQIASLFCKSLSAAPAALVGYLIKSPITQTNNSTQPPK